VKPPKEKPKKGDPEVPKVGTALLLANAQALAEELKQAAEAAEAAAAEAMASTADEDKERVKKEEEEEEEGAGAQVAGAAGEEALSAI